MSHKTDLLLILLAIAVMPFAGWGIAVIAARIWGARLRSILPWLSALRWLTYVGALLVPLSSVAGGRLAPFGFVAFGAFCALVPAEAWIKRRFGQADVGARLPTAMIPKNNTNQCAATPSQSYPCILDVEIGGIRFNTVGYDSRTRRIRYLATGDEKFKTDDDLHVHGMITLFENEIFSLEGRAIVRLKTKDGWRPILEGSLLDGYVIRSADGVAVDLANPMAGKMHRFKIIGFDKGGV
jgi:hypothetical protein